MDVAIIPTPPGSIQQVIDLRKTHEVPLRQISSHLQMATVDLGLYMKPDRASDS